MFTFTLVVIAILAMTFVFLVLGLVALIRCDQAAIPETIRALSSWLGHGTRPVPLPPGHGHSVPPSVDEEIEFGVATLERKARSLEQP